MGYKLLSVITEDQSVLQDLDALLDLLPYWEMKVYNNIERAWIDYMRLKPDLSIIDLDFVPDNPDRVWDIMQAKNGHPIVVISTKPMNSKEATLASDLGALDYITKPIQMDHIAFALAIAQGPLDDRTLNEIE